MGSSSKVASGPGDARVVPAMREAEFPPSFGFRRGPRFAGAARPVFFGLALAAIIVLAIPMAGMLTRTLALTVAAAVPCVALALPFALWAHLPSSLPRAVKFMLGVFPAFLPVPLVCVVLSDSPFHLQPYGTALLVASHIAAGFPFAFVCMALLVQSVSIPALVSAVGSGHHPGKALWRAYRGTIVRACAIAVPTTALALATDPSITLIFSGNLTYLGNASLHAIESSVPPSYIWRILLIVILSCLLVTPSLVVSLSPDAPRGSRMRLPFTGISRALFAASVPTISTYAAITALCVLRTLHRFPSISAESLSRLSLTLRTTTVLLVPAILLSLLLCALISRWCHERPHLREHSVRAAVSMLLIGHTCAGMFIAAIHSVDGTLPSLVGGASFGQGAFGILIAYLAIAVPTFFLVMGRTLVDNSAMIDAARDAGASALRTFITVVLPRTSAPWLGATAFVGALLLSRSAPAVYVDSPLFPQAAAALTTAAASGDDATTYVLGTAIILVCITLVLAAVIIFVSSIGRAHESRRH